MKGSNCSLLPRARSRVREPAEGPAPGWLLRVARHAHRLLVLALVLLSAAASSQVQAAAAADKGSGEAVLDRWLEGQAKIESWSADVVETRRLENLANPIVSHGKVWFEKPNRFRWQLGNPPRTIAVRKGEELLVVYPRLKRVERYAMGDSMDPAWRQALALLDVGFPNDTVQFHAQYELLSTEKTEEGWRFELQPRAVAARELIAGVTIDVSGKDLTLLATELEFPDGSTLRNQFLNPEVNPRVEPSLFEVEVGKGYQVVNPLQPEQTPASEGE